MVEKLDDIPAIDIEVLNQHFMGDEDFKIYFLNLAIQELHNNIEILDKSKEDKDSVELKNILHKLKGSAATVGLCQLTSKITFNENLLAQESIDAVDYDDIIRSIAKSINTLKNLIKE